MSAIVMLVLGFALASMFSQRLIDAKVEVANNEVDRARVIVEQQIDATGTNASLQARLNAARAALAQMPQSGKDSSSAYEPVLIVAQRGAPQVTSPENYRIPDELQRFVSEGQISYQFAEAERSDGSRYKSLIVGTPTSSDVPNLQVYLVMSLESEESTLALMRGLLSLAAGVVVVLLVAIVWLAAQQVTGPVRSASRVAQRLAAGHLRERMAVNGEDEMARLALSFNDMADKLSDQIHQLEEYGDLQRQFTSDVSHEIRTPLTTMRMAVDMFVASAEGLEPHQRRSLELMERELDRFEDLIADLLEISKHDAGSAELSANPVIAQECVMEAWAQTKHLAERLDLEFRFDMPEEPITIVADPRRVERILRNLFANAVDHSEGNPVDIAVRAGEKSVAFTVTDQGVGLKPGQESLIFNRFWRADPSRRRHSGGTGLGLAIAQKDANLHGGILDAVGTFGVGSQFRLVLPLKANDPMGESPLALVAPVSRESTSEETNPGDTEEERAHSDERPEADRDTPNTSSGEAPSAFSSASNSASNQVKEDSTPFNDAGPHDAGRNRGGES